MHRCDFDQTSELHSQSRTVSTELGHVQKLVELMMAICCHRREGVDSTPHISLFLMQWTRTDCSTSLSMAQESVGERHLIHMITHVVRQSIDRYLTLCSSPWSFSCPFFHVSLELKILPPLCRHRDNFPLALRQVRSLAPWPEKTSQKTRVISQNGKRKNQDSPWLKKKKQILAEVRTDIRKHEFQADSDSWSIEELEGIREFQRKKIFFTVAGDVQLRRNQLFLHEQLLKPNRDLREAQIICLFEMEELKSVQELRVDWSSRRRLIENRDIINELTASIQELQNHVNCMNDSRFFKMLNQHAVD